MNIVVTDLAKEQLRMYRKDNNEFMRINVESGGCSGMTYKAVIDTTVNDQDEIVYEDGDIKIVSDSRSALFLGGLHVDYSNDLIQSGFRLSNSNASESCACGASFSV